MAVKTFVYPVIKFLVSGYPHDTDRRDITLTLRKAGIVFDRLTQQSAALSEIFTEYGNALTTSKSRLENASKNFLDTYPGFLKNARPAFRRATILITVGTPPAGQKPPEALNIFLFLFSFN